MAFTKLPSNENLALWIGPTASGALGITDIAEPLAAEINNTGGTSGMQQASQSTSWNDWDFGTQASETLNEPSLADSASFEEFGQANFGGSASHYYPLEYDDNSNQHSVIYDLVAIPGTNLDFVVRLDGEVDSMAVAANGDFVSAYRVQSDGETNPFTPGESKRYTKSYAPRSEFAHFTVVGDHAITTIPATTDTPAAGEKARYRATQQSRDVTNRLVWSTSDATVIEVYPGGAYEVTGSTTDTATVTVTDPDTGDTANIAVTVA